MRTRYRVKRSYRWLMFGQLLLITAFMTVVALGSTGWFLAELKEPFDVDVLKAGCCSVVGVAIAGMLILALPGGLRPTPDLDVRRDGVWLAADGADEGLFVPWSEITDVTIGGAPGWLPALELAAAPPPREPAVAATYAAITADPALRRRWPHGTVVGLALCPRSSAQATALADAMERVDRDAERIRARGRIAAADQVDAARTLLRHWQEEWSARRQPLGMWIMVSSRRIDIERLDEVARLHGPGPIVRRGTLTQDELDTPHGIARVLARGIAGIATPD